MPNTVSTPTASSERTIDSAPAIGSPLTGAPRSAAAGAGLGGRGRGGVGCGASAISPPAFDLTVWTCGEQTKTPRPGSGWSRGARSAGIVESDGRVSAPGKYYDDRQRGHVQHARPAGGPTSPSGTPRLTCWYPGSYGGDRKSVV